MTNLFTLVAYRKTFVLQFNILSPNFNTSRNSLSFSLVFQFQSYYISAIRDLRFRIVLSFNLTYFPKFIYILNYINRVNHIINEKFNHISKTIYTSRYSFLRNLDFSFVYGELSICYKVSKINFISESNFNITFYVNVQLSNQLVSSKIFI